MTTNNACNYSPTQYTIQSGGVNGQLTSISPGVSNSTLQGSTGADPSFTTTPQIVALGIGTAPGAVGLQFNGSNVLSTYEIGTFTPGIAFGGASVGVTYSNQTGFYTKIGATVFFSLNVVLTSKGISTGNVTFTSLPFTNTAVTNRLSIISSNITFVGNYISADVIAGTSGNIFRVITAGGNTVLTNTAFANNSSFTITGFYQG